MINQQCCTTDQNQESIKTVLGVQLFKGFNKVCLCNKDNHETTVETLAQTNSLKQNFYFLNGSWTCLIWGTLLPILLLSLANHNWISWLNFVSPGHLFLSSYVSSLFLTFWKIICYPKLSINVSYPCKNHHLPHQINRETKRKMQTELLVCCEWFSKVTASYDPICICRTSCNRTLVRLYPRKTVAKW